MGIFYSWGESCNVCADRNFVFSCLSRPRARHSPSVLDRALVSWRSANRGPGFCINQKSVWASGDGARRGSRVSSRGIADIGSALSMASDVAQADKRRARQGAHNLQSLPSPRRLPRRWDRLLPPATVPPPPLRPRCWESPGQHLFPCRSASPVWARSS